MMKTVHHRIRPYFLVKWNKWMHQLSTMYRPEVIYSARDCTDTYGPSASINSRRSGARSKQVGRLHTNAGEGFPFTHPKSISTVVRFLIRLQKSSGEKKNDVVTQVTSQWNITVAAAFWKKSYRYVRRTSCIRVWQSTSMCHVSTRR